MSPRRFCVLAALLALFATCVFSTAAQADVFSDPIAPTASAQTSPTIASDQADYQPGSTVILTGGNWQPGESVQIVVNDDGTDPNQPWQHDATVTADAQGGISDTFQLPNWFVASYSVTATGASGTAQTTFTDGTLSFRLANDSTSVASGWSVSYRADNSTASCGSLGSVQSTTTGSIGIGTGHSAQVTGASASGYNFGYWSATAASTTAIDPSCFAGTTRTIYAHFTPVAPADTTAPAIAFTQTPNGSNGWFNSGSATVHVTATDASGVASLACKIDDVATTLTSTASTSTTRSGDVSTSTDGDHTVSCQAVDSASPANTAAYADNSTHLKRDTVAPTISKSAKNADNTAYTADTWTNQDVTVSFSCDDSGSGSTSTLTGGTVSTEGASGSVTSSGTCTDAAGNTASPATATFSPIKIDKTAPVISATAKNADNTTYTAGTWTNQSVSVSFSCTDSGSGRDSSVAFGGNQTLSTETSSGSVTSTGHCKDLAGNEASPTSATVSPIKIDKTAPVISADTHGYTAGSWTNQDVTVDFSCADSGSVQSGKATDTVGGNTSVTSDTAAAGRDVTNTGTCVDNAGNTATPNTVNVKRDTVAPTISKSAKNADNTAYTAYTADTWTNQDVTVSFSCDDALSGSTSTLTGGTVSTEGASGSVTSSGTCTDRAGNSASPATATFSPIKIDKTAPTISKSAKNADNTAYTADTWTNQDVTVSFSCDDTLSGSTSTLTGGTVSTDGDSGSVTSSGTCTDRAGNTASPATATFSPIKIDTTKPVISADTGGYVPGTWTNQDVSISFSCSDAGAVQSGMATDTVGGDDSVTSDTAAIGHDVTSTGDCVDNAGNAADAATVNVKRDTVAPTISADTTNHTSETAYTPGTWTNESVDISFTCTDALSGRDTSVDFGGDTTLTDETDSGSASSTGHCKDLAGNEASPDSVTVSPIKIDKTAPTISKSAKNADNTAYTADTWTNQDVTVSFSCDDSGSGSTSTLTGGTVSTEGASGSVTSSGTCTDAAGNTASPATATFSPIKIDKTAPVISADTHGYTAGTWTNQDVSVSFSCTDSGSGRDTSVDFGGDTTLTDETDSGSASSTGHCKDLAGNEASPGSVTVSPIKIDKTAPTISASTKNADDSDYTPGTWTNQSVKVAFTCTDGGSGRDTNVAFGGNTTLSDETDAGSATSTGHCKDVAGNEASPDSVTVDQIKIDKTKPVIAADTHGYSAGSWTNQNVTVDFSCGDPNGDFPSGIGTGGDTVSGGETVDSDTPKIGHNVASGGSCVDRAGNSADQNIVNVKRDTVAPTISKSATNHTSDTPYTAGTWTNETVDVSFSCDDALSGSTSTLTGGSVSTEGDSGSVTSSGTCEDAAGNSASPATATFSPIKIDETAPTISASTKNADDSDYTPGTWTNQSVKVSFSCTDDRSGRDTTVDFGGNTTLTAETDSGSASSTGHCKDLAGNEASPDPVTVDHIKIDKTKPVISADTHGYTAGTWTNQDVTVDGFSCADAGTVQSGVDHNTVGGGQTINSDTPATGTGVSNTGACDDHAGNAALGKTVNVKVDKTDPSISATATTADTQSYTSGTWTNQSVKVHFDCNDALSGIATCPSDQTLSDETPTTGTSVSGTATDVAGNHHDSNAVVVKIDKTKPVVTVGGVTSGGIYTLGSVPAASCVTTDSLSGTKTNAQLTISGGPTGYVTATCSGGEDNAGNKRTTAAGDDVAVTYQVLYRWDGYLQPINDTAHQIGTAESKFKLGSTIPVKVQLKRGDGTTVQAGTAPGFAQKRIGSACDNTTDTETSVASDATLGSAFRWDSTLSGYIYNFSTKGLQAGEYRVYASMDDGLVRTVDLCLTK